MESTIIEIKSWQDLKDLIATFSSEQLAMPVEWDGDERGGTVKQVAILAEDHYSDGEFVEALSTLEDQDDDLYPENWTLKHKKNQPILGVD